MIKKNNLKYVINTLIKNNNFNEAVNVLNAFEKIAQDTDDFEILGECASIANHLELFLQCAKYVYVNSKTSEQLFSSRVNLYNAYLRLNYPNEALFYININLMIKPTDEESLLSKSGAISLTGDYKSADNLLSSMHISDEKLNKSKNNFLFRKLLCNGKTSEGILNFINIDKQKNKLFENILNLKFWNGVSKPGSTIVINMEGGIGDEFINIRFIDRLKKLGMNVIIYTDPSRKFGTLEVFKRHGFNIVDNHLFFKKEYLWTNLLSLPAYLGVNESNLWTKPYITPLRQEKNKLHDTNFKIGIKCDGNLYFHQEIYRKIPIDEMLEALPKGASIYYFDKDKTHPDTISLADKLETWEDTLDYIDQMDIIVSSCTSLVHAAGAMGKRTIVIVPIAKYYLWYSTRTDDSSPWYGDNFTVITQSKPRSWKEPLEKVKLLLNDYYTNFDK